MLPTTKTFFRTDDAALQKLYDTACEKIRGNLRLFGPDRVLVEGGGYRKIWLETQPMGGEMYAGHDLQAALNNTLLFMRTQRADGRLAGSIQCLEDGGVEPQFDKLQGFCFPWPALNLYYWIGEDRAYLNRLAACLEAFDAWLWKTRDPNGDGCLESFCVYDTGEDNAVRYGDAPNYCPSDTPPENSRIVPMTSMDLTSYSYACRDTLAEISRIRRDGQEARWRRAADEVAAALKSRLWDEKKAACFDRDKTGRTLPVLTHNNLRCMYWGSFSKEMADAFVTRHLLDPAEFWTHLPLPSVAANDPAFRNAPENNWSGQCEGLTWQRAILALERYGYGPLVTQLGKKVLQAVIGADCVFTQQFDPFTGEASRVGMVSHEVLSPGSSEPFQDGYGPTILAVLAYIAHIFGVYMERGRLHFSLGSGTACEYELTWGDRVYRIENDGREACIFVDGVRKHRHACGVCLVTDRGGELLEVRPIE